MIPDNPNTARQTDDHDFPTPEACRSAARQTYAFSRSLRYDHDDALDRAADAVYDLLPVPAHGNESYDELLHDRDRYLENAEEAVEALADAEARIRDLRSEIADAEEEIVSLRCQLAEADDRITELAKDYL